MALLSLGSRKVPGGLFWVAWSLVLGVYGEAFLYRQRPKLPSGDSEYVVIRDIEPKKSSLPDPQPSPLSSAQRLERGLVGKNLQTSLRRWGLGPRNRQAVTNLLRTEGILLKAGQVVGVHKDSTKRVQRVTWSSDITQGFELIKVCDDQWNLKRVTYVLEHKEVTYQGKVHLHLLEALQRQGITRPIGEGVIRILGEAFDVRRHFPRGSRFVVILKENHVPAISYKQQANILALWVQSPRHTSVSVYQFDGPGGQPEYFDEKGVSLRPSFLASPVAQSRISSKFGMRKHPILGYQKMHPAIDFAAPMGTPVRAVAEGKVEKAHYTRGYGHYIRLRHRDGYQTAYAHLQRYAKGLSAGKRVAQGEIIGYVGRTGQATGPHLHFEMLKQGRHIDPQKVLVQPVINLKGDRLQAFHQHVKDLQQRHPVMAR